MGTMPFGCLLEGAIADKIGVPYTFLLNGIALLIAAFIFSSKLKYFEVKSKELIEETIETKNSYIPSN